MKRLVRYLLTAAVVLIVLVVGFFGLVLVASELGGEVITLHTQTASGEKRTHLWVVDDAGFAWVRAGMSGSGWLARIERNPIVLVERGGRLIRYRAVPVRQPQVRDRIHALMLEKYGRADRLVSVLRDPAQSVPVRLEPLGPAR
ncbi:MAG TPA: hypothetical protein VGT00_17175 [Methylomirabilota bacterium]|nr:hypothetical protein [Methylomirabilota bacterium]